MSRREKRRGLKHGRQTSKERITDFLSNAEEGGTDAA